MPPLVGGLACRTGIHVRPWRRGIACVAFVVTLGFIRVEPASALTVTPAGAARGFALSTFATGFPSNAAIGPLGIGYRGPAAVLVMDNPNGQIYVLPSHADDQIASTILATTYGDLNAKGFCQVPDTTGPYYSRFYMTQHFTGGGQVVEIDPATGATIRVLAKGIAGIRGICPFPQDASTSSPLRGKLLVSNPDGIYLVDPALSDQTPTTPLITGDTDGICFTPDGSQLVAAHGGIRVYAVAPTPTLVASSPDPVTSDGITVGLGALAGYCYVNCNDGTVFEYGLPGGPSPGSLTEIANGGSRGDFVAIDPVHTCGDSVTFPSMLLTQTSSIERLCYMATPAGGFFGPPSSSLILPPGPGFPLDPPPGVPRKIFNLVEPPEFTTYNLNARVRSGYVILKQSAAAADTDSTAWSDVVAFTLPPNKPTAVFGNPADHAYLVSDVTGSVDDSALAQIPHPPADPITCRDIRKALAAGRAVAIAELKIPTVYFAGPFVYKIFSDVEVPYDGTHYWSYSLQAPKDTLISITAHDQFLDTPVYLDTLSRLVNWVRKNGSYVRDTTLHFTWWDIQNKQRADFEGRITNQFGSYRVRTHSLAFMLVPALKNRPEDPAYGVSHYLCYKASGFPSPLLGYDLLDEWRQDRQYPDSLEYLCVPCSKQHNGYDYEPADTVTHLAVYGIHPLSDTFYPFVEDQFDSAQVYVEQRSPKEYLFVPSHKDSVRFVAVGLSPPETREFLAASPNPIHGRGEFVYVVAVRGKVELEVFGLDGRRVRRVKNGPATPGRYRVAWDGANDRGQTVPSGIYFARLRTASGSLTRQVVYLR